MIHIKGKHTEVSITGVHTCLNCEKEMETSDMSKLLCSKKCLLELNKYARKQGVQSHYNMDDIK